MISSISNGIGTGLLESVDYPDPDHMKKAHPKKTPLHILENDWRIPLMLNLRVKPSSIFVSSGEDQEEVDFNWHCKSGLAANIQTVKEEFCKKRGLKPVKIFITGPPASGKSFYAKQLSEHYNVPHIYLEHMIKDIETWNKEKEEGIHKRREVKQRMREHEEAIRRQEEEEHRRSHISGFSQQSKNKAANDVASDNGAKPSTTPDDTIVADQIAD